MTRLKTVREEITKFRLRFVGATDKDTSAAFDILKSKMHLEPEHQHGRTLTIVLDSQDNAHAISLDLKSEFRGEAYIEPFTVVRIAKRAAEETFTATLGKRTRKYTLMEWTVWLNKTYGLSVNAITVRSAILVKGGMQEALAYFQEIAKNKNKDQARRLERERTQRLIAS